MTEPLDRSRPRPNLSIAISLGIALLCGAPSVVRAGGHHGDHHHGRTRATVRTPLDEAQAELLRARRRVPPPAAGVTDLAFAELLGPIGDRGLTYSEKVRTLDGTPVRMLGYMVSQDQPVPGTILLAPFPFQLHETEYGLAEDLPATLVHVFVPDLRHEIVPYTPGLLLLTGELSIGTREEPDGRISTVRLRLHPRPDAASQDAAHPKEKKP